jgi:hypothetical protein
VDAPRAFDTTSGLLRTALRILQRLTYGKWTLQNVKRPFDMKNFAPALLAVGMAIAAATIVAGPAVAQSSPCNPAVETCL